MTMLNIIPETGIACNKCGEDYHPHSWHQPLCLRCKCEKLGWDYDTVKIGKPSRSKKGGECQNYGGIRN